MQTQVDPKQPYIPGKRKPIVFKLFHFMIILTMFIVAVIFMKYKENFRNKKNSRIGNR